jgi:electron transport complex protein RnfA
MEHAGYFELIIGAIFVNNVLLGRFLGNCPFLGTSKKMDTAIGMALAVVFVIALASMFTWLVQKYLLDKYGIAYIQTLTFILVIAALVQFVEMFLKKSMPALYKALGIFLPLITTNCAVLGVAIEDIDKKFDLIHAVTYATASAAGFGLALVLFAGVREKFAVSRIPKAVDGTGIGLITAGLFSLAFFAFKGMI